MAYAKSGKQLAENKMKFGGGTSPTKGSDKKHTSKKVSATVRFGKNHREFLNE